MTDPTPGEVYTDRDGVKWTVVYFRRNAVSFDITLSAGEKSLHWHGAGAVQDSGTWRAYFGKPGV